MFRVAAGYSINFCQLSVHPRDHASNFHASVRHSVNFPFVRGTFRQLWSTLRVSAVPSINFPQHFVHPWDLLKCSVQLLDLPSTSVNYPCDLGIFCQLSVHPRDLQSTSVNFLCSSGTFRQHSLCLEDHLSTFLVSSGLSINFRELSVRPWDFTSILQASIGLSVNFGRRTFCQHQLTFRASAELTVNLCQLFLRLGDLLSTFLA